MRFTHTAARFAAAALLSSCLGLCACTGSNPGANHSDKDVVLNVSDRQNAQLAQDQKIADAKALLDLHEDYRKSFEHGPKGSEFQKYIVLHDTEGDGPAEGVINWWDNNRSGVASHFVVNKDGSVWQCVPLDVIAHHAGFGDTGNNEKFKVEDESRDDKIGTTSIGDWAADYGMNSYSVGIEMVHVGGSGDYPEEQLKAVDNLIAYIDAYYGKQSEIIDHNDWRTGNSDTSQEFQPFMKNYQKYRTHSAN